jgi:Zn-dependent oligopeptidase
VLNDAFTETVFKDDPLDPVKGKLYRDKILRPGASKDAMELLKVNDLTSWSTIAMADKH